MGCHVKAAKAAVEQGPIERGITTIKELIASCVAS